MTRPFAGVRIFDFTRSVATSQATIDTRPVFKS